MSAHRAEQQLQEAQHHAYVAEIHMQNLEADNAEVANALSNVAIAKAMAGIGFALLEVAEQIGKLSEEKKSPARSTMSSSKTSKPTA